VDLVLVHGLTGNSVATWTNDADSFWPAWLSKDYEYVNVWTADYPAPLTRLATKGSRFDIRSSAKALVDYCATTSLGSRNTVWVAHSLGGLVLKQLLYVSKDLQASRYKRFWDTTRGVVFLATPHTGNGFAGAVRDLGFPRPSEAVRDLAPGSFLNDLNTWFRNNADPSALTVLSYAEKEPLKVARVGTTIIVSEAAADPGIKGSVCIPVPHDHMTIAKLPSRDDPIYRALGALVQDLAPEETSSKTEGSARRWPVQIESRTQQSSDAEYDGSEQIAPVIRLRPRRVPAQGSTREILERLRRAPMPSSTSKGSQGAALLALEGPLRQYVDMVGPNTRSGQLAKALEALVGDIAQAGTGPSRDSAIAEYRRMKTLLVALLEAQQ